MEETGQLIARCVWVNDNAFYWEAIEYEIKAVKVMLWTKKKKFKVQIHEVGNLEDLFDLAAEMQWKYEYFTLELNKENL